MSLMDSYVYEVNLEWSGGRSGNLNAQGLPPLEVSAPPEFSGDPGRWTPEHLLTAATASCFMATFLAVAKLQRLTLQSFKLNSYARLEKVPGEGYRFTEITLAPEIGVASEDVEKARKALNNAERHCFITNSLRTKVQVEPRFVPATAELCPQG